MIEKLPSDPSRDTHHVDQHIGSHMRSWSVRFTPHFVLSAVVAASLSLFGQNASALALGRVAVQSALGEVLNAEIDIPDINPDEAGSLRVSIGSVEAFRRAGLEYTPAVAGLRVSIQRRADGRAYLRLRSDRIINDPFLDLIVEANWAAGQLSRDYTLLFDPPVARQTPPAPTAPQISPLVTSRAARTSTTDTVTGSGSTPPPSATAEQTRAPTNTANTASRRLRAKPAEKQEPVVNQTGQQITVHAGDTASKIASSIKPSSISLDQMLIALLQANPNAFSAANVNRLKAGAVLDVPSAQAAGATSANEASQMVLAQSRDFNDFRRKLASGAAVTTVEAGRRTSSGKVRASIEDKKTSSTLPDKLSLHKGEISGKTKDLAKDLQAKEAANRLAELNKNINELQKLSTDATKQPSKGANGVSPPVKASSAQSLPVAASIPVAEPVASPTSAPASVPTTTPVAATPTKTTIADTPTLQASVPAISSTTPSVTATATATAKAPAVPASAAASAPAVSQEPTESSFLSDLMENPWSAPSAGGLVALLAGLGLYRARQRKKSAQVDSTFSESRLQPDSFFGTSGGGKIDTNESSMAASSMMYSPSQLDAGADVDPVAEADVYLAYGRDLQAEEILKEALRVNPARAAIHFKLLQIYAKRKDILSYAATAAEAYKLTHGIGSEWAQACEVGREIDPPNPLYHGDGASSFVGLSATEGTPTAAPDSAFSSTDIFAHQPDAEDIQALKNLDGNIDLDLDFSDVEPAEQPLPNIVDEVEPSGLPDLNFELDTPLPVEPPSFSPFMSDDQPEGIEYTPDNLPELGNAPVEIIPAPEIEVEPEVEDFDLDPRSLDLDIPSPDPELEPERNEPVLDEFGDLEDSSADDLGPDEDAGDPLVTKLALAEEFQAIGDDDGARTLAQEVADEATGSLKARAEQFLTELG